MKCSKCGAELNENAKFCEICGQPVEENGKASLAKKKFPLIAGVAAIAAVLAVVFALVIPAIRKANLNPTEYMQSMEQKSAEGGEEYIASYMGQFQKSLDLEKKSRVGVMKITLSDEAKSMINSYSGMLGMQAPDFSKLKDITLEATVNRKDNAFGEKVVFKSNDVSLLTLNMYMDFSAKKMYYQIPELSEAYLDFSDSLSSDETGEAMKAVEFMNGFLTGDSIPSTDDVNTFCERYAKLLTDSLKDVKKEKDKTCEAEGISQKADVYTAKYNEKDILALFESVITTMKTDEQILGYLKKADIDEKKYTDALDDTLKDLKESSVGSGYGVISDYIAEDEVVGREIILYEDEKSSNTYAAIRMMQPKDNDKFGYLLSVETKDEPDGFLKMTGKGTLKDEVMSGEFSIVIPTLAKAADASDPKAELVHVKVSDFDLAKMKKGEASGTTEFTVPGIASISTFKLTMESSGTVEKAESKIDVSMGGQSLASIEVTNQTGEKMDVSEPGSDVTVYKINKDEDMEKYMGSLNVVSVLENIKEQTGIDLSALLSGAFGA